MSLKINISLNTLINIKLNILLINIIFIKIKTILDTYNTLFNRLDMDLIIISNQISLINYKIIET